MKLCKYITILSFLVIAGCSSDEDSVSKTQSLEQTKDAKQLQTDTGTKQTKNEGVFDHYKRSIDSAKAAKQLLEDSEKKKKELKQGI